MASQKTLTAKIAGKYEKDANSVDLSEFTVIEDDAIRLLAALDPEHNEGFLDLGGLSEITSQQLSLFRMSSLSLSCSGVTHITPDMASVLKDFANCKIGFLGVSEVDDSVLVKLTEYSGPGLFLGLTDVSEHQAKILATCKSQVLALLSLERIDEEAAMALVKYEGELNLRLRPLPIESRRILRQHPSFGGWGEVQTYAEPVCKFCGEKGRIYVFDDVTPFGMLRHSDKTATEGWIWNICSACNDGLSDEEVDNLINSDA